MLFIHWTARIPRTPAGETKPSAALSITCRPRNSATRLPHSSACAVKSALRSCAPKRCRGAATARWWATRSVCAAPGHRDPVRERLADASADAVRAGGGHAHHISPRAGDPAVTKGPTGRGLEQELENAPDSVLGKAQIGRRRTSRVSVEPPLIDSLTVERLRLGGLFSTRGIAGCILPYSGHRGSGRTGMKVSEHESNFYHLLHRVARVKCLVVIHGTERFSYIFRGSFLGARGGAAADNLSEPRRPTRGRASQS
jgi:hypothetical protein